MQLEFRINSVSGCSGKEADDEEGITLGGSKQPLLLSRTGEPLNSNPSSQQLLNAQIVCCSTRRDLQPSCKTHSTLCRD